jgi:molecular chaperone GrpE (heat shock protein)
MLLILAVICLSGKVGAFMGCNNGYFGRYVGIGGQVRGYKGMNLASKMNSLRVMPVLGMIAEDEVEDAVEGMGHEAVKEEEEEVIGSEVMESQELEEDEGKGGKEGEPKLSETKKAIKAREEELANELRVLEEKLCQERRMLSRTKDNVSESGKPGFFMIQAKVSEFLKRKDKEQRNRVEANKRDFVQKMLPIIDLFREAPTKAPATSERERTMHATFGSLLDSIMVVLGKYGYAEFTPEVDMPLSPTEHEVVEMEDVEGKDGLVLRVLRAGVKKAGDEGIFRRARVVGGRGSTTTTITNTTTATATATDDEPTVTRDDAGSQEEEKVDEVEESEEK